MSGQQYDNYLDLESCPGEDLNFDLQITPVVTTGAAVMTVTFPSDFPQDYCGPTGATSAVTFQVNCTNFLVGVNPYISFDLNVPGITAATGASGPYVTTSTWPIGIYDYKVVATFSDGSVEKVCIGTILMTRN